MNVKEQFNKILSEQPVVIAKVGDEEIEGRSMVALVSDGDKMGIMIGGHIDAVTIMEMIAALDEAREKLVSILVDHIY